MASEESTRGERDARNKTVKSLAGYEPGNQSDKQRDGSAIEREAEEMKRDEEQRRECGLPG